MRTLSCEADCPCLHRPCLLLACFLFACLQRELAEVYGESEERHVGLEARMARWVGGWAGGHAGGHAGGLAALVWPLVLPLSLSKVTRWVPTWPVHTVVKGGWLQVAPGGRPRLPGI
jgi:hypothetical protein